jgi:ComF family protein
MTFLQDTINIFFPRVCLLCEKDTKSLHNVCIACAIDMSYYPFSYDDSNCVISQTFWGRINVLWAAALLISEKGSKTNLLLHTIKYENGVKLAQFLGGELGKQILSWPSLPDLIIPVPLHPLKRRKRGYNQAAEIAKGVSVTTEIEVYTKGLTRKKHTKSQTQLSRADRLSNMEAVFELKNSKELEGKHILLVDDVLTTGATIEACAKVLPESCKISIAVLAYANN